MRTIPDELLMAYVDRELDAKTREMVGKALEADPDVRERLEVFSLTREPLAALFSAPMREPVPERLRAAVLNSASTSLIALKPAKKVQNASALDFWDLLKGGWTPRFATGFAAIVVVGIGVGFGIGWSLTRSPPIQTATSQPPTMALAPQGIVAGGEFGRALEATASGNSVDVTDGAGSAAKLKPVFTFASSADGFCRQYELESSQGVYAGLACRGSDEVWRVRVHVPAVPRPAYKPGELRLSERREAVDAVVDRMIVGDVLPVKRETELINDGWKRPQ